ncbi:MAG: hypothetical protein LWW93_03245 [Hyphomicrobiales bacterium]|nr:hypothetical protein [Hyphomicrobiales bacterium]
MSGVRPHVRALTETLVRLARAVGPAVALLAPAAAVASEALCLDGPRETVWAETAVSGDELRLLDGRRLRLADVEVPPPSLTHLDPDARAVEAAAAEAARRALTDRIEGRELSLLDLGEDRWGRRVGHLVDTETGHWIEGDLAAEGVLRVAPRRDDAICVAALLLRETAARTGRRGLWGEAVHAVRPADRRLAERVGDTVVAEGVVRSIGRSGGRTWLNFGEDIVRDFAVVMNDKDRVRFERAGLSIDRLRGRSVRVRGVVQRRGEAPRMAIDDPASIEPVER